MQTSQADAVRFTPKAAKGLRDLRALIVDDNRYMRQLLRTLLRGYGVREMFEASDARSGIDLIGDIRPHFVLTDDDLKPVSGVAFVKMIRQLCPPPLCSVPVILITARADMQRIQAARDAGVTEALCKPVTAKNLFERITEILERPRGFVRTTDFIGPDRRRRSDSSYNGPKRRSEDAGIATQYLPE